MKEFVHDHLINDSFSGLPLVIVLESKSATITAFERLISDTTLTFRWEEDGMIDDQTSSVWDPVSGRAIQGKLAGHRLTPVSGTISHLRAWRTLHPQSEPHSNLSS